MIPGQYFYFPLPESPGTLENGNAWNDVISNWIGNAFRWWSLKLQEFVFLQIARETFGGRRCEFKRRIASAMVHYVAKEAHAIFQ